MSRDAHHALRTSFTQALLSRDPAARPARLDGRAGERFAIHRNNVHRALGEALADAYPRTTRLVGEEFFMATAREFFLREPPRRASLVLYGDGFGNFLASFPPAEGVPYLADVARLERACLESMHSADAPALEAASLERFGEQLPTVRLRAHPAARVVESAYPVVSIWRHSGVETSRIPRPVVFDSGCEHALVTRPEFEVRVQALGRAESAFARALLALEPISAAHATATALERAFDVTGAFARLLATGTFAAIHAEE